MSVRPIGTLPLRASLRGERMRNRRELRDGAKREGSTSSWKAPSSLSGLTVRIDPYPDLGHQMSTWIAGYLWAQDLGLPFFGGVVSKDNGGLFELSGLGTRPAGVRLERRLAATGFETEGWALPALQHAVDRVALRRPWVGRLALDQRRFDQTPVAPALRAAVLAGRYGQRLLAAEGGPAYVAVHVRRGDIGPDTHPDRWLGRAFYERLIAEIRMVPALSSIPVRVFTSGDASDLRPLESMNVSINVNGSRDEDFVAIAGARLVVAAPSSFGFLAALVSNSPVIARVPWWHHVPNTGRWIAYEPSKGLDIARLRRLTSGSLP